MRTVAFALVAAAAFWLTLWAVILFNSVEVRFT